jgi:hypothetical protein
MKLSKRKKQERLESIKKKEVTCPNCNCLTANGHFIPPSSGQKGRFICDGFTR